MLQYFSYIVAASFIGGGNALIIINTHMDYCGFLRVLRFPLPIKLTATIKLKYC
jgi:hypothetical protein